MGIRPWNIDALRLWQRVLPMIDLIANPACGIQVMNHLGSRHTRQDIQSQAMAEPILSDTVLMDMICLHPKRMNTEEASVAP